MAQVVPRRGCSGCISAAAVVLLMIALPIKQLVAVLIQTSCTVAESFGEAAGFSPDRTLVFMLGQW